MEHKLCHQIPKSEGKRTVSTADELYYHLPPFRRKFFSLLAFTWIVFLFVTFFYSIKEYYYLSGWPKHGSSESFFFFFFFFCGSIVFVEGLVFEGKASQLAVLNSINSPRTYQVALKGGSAREQVIFVILNSVGKPQPMCVPCFDWWIWRNEQQPANPRGTWRVIIYIYIYRPKIYIYHLLVIPRSSFSHTQIIF